VALGGGLTLLCEKYRFENKKYIGMGHQQIMLAFLELRKLEMWEN
jgi:hypothetical protein